MKIDFIIFLGHVMCSTIAGCYFDVKHFCVFILLISIYSMIFRLLFSIQFIAFIDKLSRAMKLDEVAVEAGFDISSDAILLRAQQLSKSEVDI